MNEACMHALGGGPVQAEVMKGALKDPAALVGGMRVVELRGKGRAKVGRFERWIKSLAWVIADNFDAQHFTRRSSKAVQVRMFTCFLPTIHQTDSSLLACLQTSRQQTLDVCMYGLGM